MEFDGTHIRKFLDKSHWDNSKKQIVLVACGSFSPITYLHVRLFEIGRDFLHDNDEFQVIGGLISPVGDGYKKEGLVNSFHRLAMCKLAVDDSEWIDIDEWETSQPQYKRTLEVLNNIQLRLDRLLPGSKVMFLAGADLIQSFATPGLWAPEDRDRILDKYGCVVVERWNADISEFLLTDPILYKYRKQIHVAKQFISNDISSTKIRLYIERGLSIKYLLPDLVIEYIKRHNLYNNLAE